jgi:predicted ABC-type ATPase
MWVIAGPNGSGKSTLTSGLELDPGFPALYINADQIKINENLGDYEAMARAEEYRQAAMSKRISFAFETVMSHHSKTDFMRRAKAEGYTVKLYFVLTEDPAINIRRVAYRRATGGHDVPINKIVDRYYRSVNYLKEAIKTADIAYVYNNSWENPILIAEKHLDGEILAFPMNGAIPESEWTEKNIRALLGLGSGPSENQSDNLRPR